MSDKELKELLKLKEAQYSEVEKWFKEECDSSSSEDTVAEWEKKGIKIHAQIELLRFILWLDDASKAK